MKTLSSCLLLPVFMLALLLAPRSAAADRLDGWPWRSYKQARVLTVADLLKQYQFKPEGVTGRRGWPTAFRKLLGARDPAGTVLTLARGEERLVLTTGSRRIVWNGTAIWLNAPVVQLERGWGVAEMDVRHTLDPLCDPAPYLRPLRVKTVVLDPGHGGKDKGGVSPTGFLEKDFTLDVARRARLHLVNGGVRVKLTRDDDRSLELAERSELAKKWKADLFISIHANVAGNTDAAGVESFVLTEPGFPSTNDAKGKAPSPQRYPGQAYDAANTILGDQLHRALVEQVRANDRGLKRARFAVLRQAPCPAVLVECGFLSNPVEGGRLADPAYREQLALALTRGVLRYVGEVSRARLAE